MEEIDARTEKADRLFPRGCACPTLDGGGDCEWCRVYYGNDEPEAEDGNEN